MSIDEHHRAAKNIAKQLKIIKELQSQRLQATEKQYRTAHGVQEHLGEYMTFQRALFA
jgi:hypothetical protein